VPRKASYGTAHQASRGKWVLETFSQDVSLIKRYRLDLVSCTLSNTDVVQFCMSRYVCLRVQVLHTPGMTVGCQPSGQFTANQALENVRLLSCCGVGCLFIDTWHKRLLYNICSAPVSAPAGVHSSMNPACSPRCNQLP